MQDMYNPEKRVTLARFCSVEGSRGYAALSKVPVFFSHPILYEEHN